MKKWIAAAALTSALMGSAACAEPAPSAQTASATAAKPKPEMRTRAEFLTDAAKRFDAMDTNKGGLLSREERRAAHDRRRAGHPHPPGAGYFGPGAAPGLVPPPHAQASAGGTPDGAGGRGAMLARLDTNGDGKLTSAEFTAPFDRLDTNKDGFVDQTERAVLPTGGSAGGPASGVGGARLARLDRDGDGKISRAEYTTPFGRLDANSDGVIDKAEMDRLRGRYGGLRPNPSEAENQPQ
ncbi:MAG: hypothetical protein C0476_07275 [Sphingomonas sp.]|nr:hypothetical protein [Sphingomonas sp.]